METNYNEKLRNESIASVKAMHDYAIKQAKRNDISPKTEMYWIHIYSDLQKELELRIKQIFG